MFQVVRYDVMCLPEVMKRNTRALTDDHRFSNSLET